MQTSGALTPSTFTTRAHSAADGGETGEQWARRVPPRDGEGDHADRGGSMPPFTESDPRLSTDEAIRLARLKRLARLMDSEFALPGVGFRFGLDPLIGVVPIAGDVVSAGVSAFIVWEAHKFRLPRAVILQLSLNVIIDLAIGEIPALGDIFDFAFKANDRNIRLIERALVERARQSPG